MTNLLTALIVPSPDRNPKKLLGVSLFDSSQCTRRLSRMESTSLRMQVARAIGQSLMESFFLEWG